MFIFTNCASLKGFGQHPDLERETRFRARRARKTRNPQWVLGKRTALEALRDLRHPEVVLIPRNTVLDVVDGYGDPIGFERISFPFSSWDFYAEVDEHEGTVLYELVHNRPFARISLISQLGYLVPPHPETWDPSQSIAYITPVFPHTRGVHSLLVAMLIEVVMARNGFAPEERNPVVLTAGCHDIATPACGDPIKLLDPAALDEEANFPWVLQRWGLDERWKGLFGFDLGTACSWVKNEGVFGQLLDAVDKIAYVALDCYHVGRVRPGKIQDFCLTHPLIADVWQDIRFTPDRSGFGFVSPDRLYDFLYLRALEHTEFLLNPYSRSFDLFLERLLRPLYAAGEITREQLLTRDDSWLLMELERHFPDKVRTFVEPDLLAWKRFETAEEQEKFCQSIGDERIERREKIREFLPGLHLPVLHNGNVLPLREVVSQEKVAALERMARQRAGYYVFYYR